MSTREGSNETVAHVESPDPASHSRNVYDEARGEQVDEDDDDDMDFEPTTEGSDENEFFDPEEDVEAEFHGQRLSKQAQILSFTIFIPLLKTMTNYHVAIEQMPRNMI